MDGTTDWFGNYKLDVTPMPINLANGNEVTVDGEITLKQGIEQGSKLVIKVTHPLCGGSKLLTFSHLYYYQKYLPISF